jgi:hypothetical protein
LLPTIYGPQAGSNFCGVACTSPDFPSCAALAGTGTLDASDTDDICNLATRVCDWCLHDEECTSSVGSGGPVCDGPLYGANAAGQYPPGYCGCVLDADCPAGDACISDGSHSSFLGICTASFSRCTPESCGGYFCNWDSGACVNVSDFETLPSCVSDADCDEKVCLEGSCVRCKDPARCTPATQTNKQPCQSAADCPDGEGCNSQSNTCGTCLGPTAQGGPYDCPPDAVCSNYWLGSLGACLPNCDRESCPASRPICAVLPSLTPDHKYCFGCLQDSDCGDAGSWCDQSFNRTFTCQPAGS